MTEKTKTKTNIEYRRPRQNEDHIGKATKEKYAENGLFNMAQYVYHVWTSSGRMRQLRSYKNSGKSGNPKNILVISFKRCSMFVYEVLVFLGSSVCVFFQDFFFPPPPVFYGVFDCHHFDCSGYLIHLKTQKEIIAKRLSVRLLSLLKIKSK